MNTRKVAIIQSSYIPWKGFFDVINDVDDFVLFDDVQYTKRDWRNRNRIKTAQGVIWLTIPVEVKGKFEQKIIEAKISDPGWAEQHWLSVKHHYGKARFFNEYKSWIESAYNEAAKLTSLSLVNHLFITKINQLLGIETRVHWSSDFLLEDGKTERLLGICEQLEASEYVSGPAAECYLQTDLFAQKGIKVRFYDYCDYPEYEQLYPPFEHTVTILDLILSTGPETIRYMKSFADSTFLVANRQ